VARLTLTLVALPGESWRLMDALRTVMPSRREPGCLGCELLLTTDPAAPSRLRYVEQWSSVDDLRGQVGSDRFSRLLEALEHASAPPEICFDLDGQQRGLEFIAEIRGGPDNLTS
jgi:quinol monooxygenase YgiN